MQFTFLLSLFFLYLPGLICLFVYFFTNEGGFFFSSPGVTNLLLMAACQLNLESTQTLRKRQEQDPKYANICEAALASPYPMSSMTPSPLMSLLLPHHVLFGVSPRRLEENTCELSFLFLHGCPCMQPQEADTLLTGN